MVAKFEVENFRIKGRRGRELNGWYAVTVYAIGILFSIFSIYYLAGFVFFDPWIFLAGHLTFALVLVFLLSPATSKSAQARFTVVDGVMALVPIATFIYLLVSITGLRMRAGVAPTNMDIVVAVLTVIMVLEGARRFFGWALPSVALVFLAYAFFGHYLPTAIQAPNDGPARIFSYLYSLNGIYGVSLSTAANYVFLFVLFGAFIQRTGVGDVFIDLANAIAGRYRGGPAKASVISSAFFGSISGSAQANVVTIGSMTIPMMRKLGYPNEYAAGIETTASIGGLFLPPIMGAGGFLMADILQIPYSEVMKSALVPALLYYAAILIAVDLKAGKLGLKGMPKASVPILWKVLLKQGYLLLPLVALVVMVIRGVPIIRVGLLTSLLVCVIGLASPKVKFGVKDVFHALSGGARAALNASIACAAAGLVVGVMSMTGLGLTVESLIMKIGGASLILSLLVAAVICVLLGMDLPITATYITVAALLGPGLIRLGIPGISAHLFLYILAATAGMTPPIAITAFAAAGVSGADPMKIALNAIRLGWVAYIIPFMFVFAPSLLLIGSPGRITVAIITALMGIYAVTGGITGYLAGHLRPFERVAFVVGGILVVYPALFSDYTGIGIIVLTLAYRFFNKIRKGEPRVSSSSQKGDTA